MPDGDKNYKMVQVEQKFYTVERNVQIVISLLKQHGIKRVIASPGTTNMTFVGSIQSDPFFEIYSSVDERSAAYIACGLASETGEPVVISCTGATASRNYMPGLTEAFYRKLPVLAITSHRGDGSIGHLIDQQIDRRSIPSDISMESVTVPIVKDSASEKYCIDEANKAIISLSANGGGPAHINLHTEYSRDFTVKELPQARIIRQFDSYDELPEIPKGRIGINVGVHQPFTHEEIESIDNFCASNDAVVFTSHISGYWGKYGINYSLLCSQSNYNPPLANPDLIISIGEIDGTPYPVRGKEVWRVSPDGKVRDTYGKLTKVFQMSERHFFENYTKECLNRNSYIRECHEEDERIRAMIPDLPFGNIWIAQYTAEKLPEGCRLFLGILNSLRSWNFFPLSSGVMARCNVGGYGIDGGLSTMIGASFAHPDKLYFGVFGDLGFFYDMNALGNRHILNNIRIMLINNGRGTEFRNYSHPCSIFGEDADMYMAAAGHYGNKSPLLVKHFAEDLGFCYLSASNKQDFVKVIDSFLSPSINEKPILLEVFTNTEDESKSLEMMQNLVKADKMLKIKQAIKQILPNSVYDTLKNM